MAWAGPAPLTLLPCSQQNGEGSTHEKLDFKLHFSCTSYLITTPCYRCVSTFQPHRPPPPQGLWRGQCGPTHFHATRVCGHLRQLSDLRRARHTRQVSRS